MTRDEKIKAFEGMISDTVEHYIERYGWNVTVEIEDFKKQVSIELVDSLGDELGIWETKGVRI